MVGAGYGFKEQVEAIHKAKADGKCKDLVLIATDKAFPHCFSSLQSPEYVVALNTEKVTSTPIHSNVHGMGGAGVDVDKWFAPVTKDNKLILPITAHPSHVRYWMNNGGGEIYWMVPSNIDKDLAELWAHEFGVMAIPRGANSGEFGFVVAYTIGSDPIGLIGMPYAYKTLQEALKYQTYDTFHYVHFCTEGKNCWTILPWMEQRTEFIDLVQYTEHKNVYNLSEGGILYDSQIIKRETLEGFLELC